jgi:TolA-binding protein
MALRRLTLSVSVFLMAPALALASGGGYDEPPQPLSYYLKRLPAKSISQVLEESGPLPKPGNGSVINATELNTAFAQGPSPELVKKIDVLLQKARANYTGPVDDNVLQDLRDLAAGKGAPSEMAAYAHWRLANPDLTLFKGTPPPELEQKLAAASAALKPHWLYLIGAIYYKNGNDTTSETYFDRVLTEFPKSARAETALFMKGRCRLSQAVAADPWDNRNKSQTDNSTATRDEAKAFFQQYLTRYPQGRYRIDVIGWIGAADYRSQNFATALDSYIQQIDDTHHPEDLPPAIVMIEKCLYHLRDSNSTDIDDVAKHPAVALALAYFAINTALTSDWNNDAEITMADGWRHDLLPKLATAVLAHKDLYRGKLGQDRYIAILAHAASDNGDQEGALKLVGLNGPTTDNDDLMFVRALVLQRAGKLDDAVAVYRAFVRKFATSPLAAGAQYRLGLTLHDQKKDGDALLELAALRGNHLPLRSQPLPAPDTLQAMPSPAMYDLESATPGSAIQVDYSGAPSEEVDQTLDTLLNFAPIESLAEALKDTDPNRAELRNDLRSVLRERCLAKEDYDGAAGYADSPELQAKFEQLAAQVRHTGSAKGEPAAKTAAELADYWANQAKLFVALPLDSSEARAFVYSSDALGAGLRRRANGQTLGMNDLDEALESRNEQLHAIDWWSRLADNATGTDAAPRALWDILQARRRIVETSPYTQQRASETNAAAVARQDYDCLLKDYPQSPEALKLAAYWTFPSAGDFKAEQSYYLFPQMVFVGIDARSLFGGGFYYPNENNLGADDKWRKALGGQTGYLPWAQQGSWKTICNALADLPVKSHTMDAAAFADEVKRQLDSAKSEADFMEQQAVINCLEDLNLLAKVPNLDVQVRSDYVSLRVAELNQAVDADLADSDLSKSAAAPADLAAKLRQEPGAAVIADFIDFVGLIDTANQRVDRTIPGLDKDGQPVTYSARDFPKLAHDAEAFLQKYPKSPKREAAMVQRLRGVVYAARPRFFSQYIDWPAANPWNGVDLPKPVSEEPLDQAAYDKALAEYNAEFPQGEYASSITALRADAAIIEQKWGDALDVLIALHDPSNKPEFQDQVAINLCQVFNGLDDTALRHDILQEILKRPAARDLLTSYVNAGGVPYLKDYLLEQLKTP